MTPWRKNRNGADPLWRHRPGNRRGVCPRGLNALFDYGIFEYGEWEAIDEEEEEEEEEEVVADVVVDKETGETYTQYRKTGNKKRIREDGSRYSLRPDKCLMLEAALMRGALRRLGGDSPAQAVSPDLVPPKAP